MLPRRKKTALLLDFDNIVRLGPGLVNRIPNWVSWIEDGGHDPAGGKRRLVSKKVYWNSHHDFHRVPFERAGFEIEVCIARRKEKASSADFEMTIDALDLSYREKGLREVIILSLDTDFLSILHRLQEKEIDVVAMVSAEARTAVYRDRANAVIPDETLRAAFDYQRPERRLFARRPGAAPASASSGSPAAGAQPHSSRKVTSLNRTPKRGSNSIAAAKPEFDLSAAAERVLRAGMQTPGKPLTKRVVTALLRDVEGFSVTPPNAYFGLGNYPALSVQLAKAAPDLQVERFQPGNFLAITYRPRSRGPSA